MQSRPGVYRGRISLRLTSELRLFFLSERNQRVSQLSPCSQKAQGTAAPAWAAMVVGLLDQAAPAEVRIDRGGWPLWRQLLPHVLAVASYDAALDEAPTPAT